MVDIADVSSVNALYQELGSIHEVIDALDGGGRIIMMQVSRPEPPPEPGAPPSAAAGFFGRPLMVDTSRMTYPQAMVDAIKQQLHVREDAINAELGQLGVTGQSEARGARR